jgi:adenylate cyclase
MDFWNAPLTDAHHARHACQAALAMQEALGQLNRQLAAECETGMGHVPHLEIGIGINSGLCVVGNMGSEQRFDYSVLGDAVNLASRLEGQCPAYGAKIILGQATAAALNGSVLCAELDIIRVKGKREPQRIFAALGPAERAAETETKAALAAIDAAVAAYRRQDWGCALQALAAAEGCRLALFDLAVFVGLYRRRIEDLRAHPTLAGWDGVSVTTSK